MSDFFKKVSYNMKENGWRTSLMAVMLMTILSLYAVGFGPNSSFFTTVYAAKSDKTKALTLGGDSSDTSKNKDNKNADTSSDGSTPDQQQSDQQQSDQQQHLIWLLYQKERTVLQT
jgi:hypothetical protein